MRPPSWPLIAMASAALAVSLTACAPRPGHIQVRDPELRAFLDRRLDKFESGNRPFGAAIASLLIKTNSPRIMEEDEYPRRPGPAPLMTVRAAGVTVREIVEEVIQKDGRCAPFEENGFLVLAPPHIYHDPRNSLNFIVDEAAVENGSPLAILNPINAKLKANGLKQISLNTDTVGGLEEDMTLRARGKTVRWILIEMAKQRGVEIGINITNDHVVFATGSRFKARHLLNYFDESVDLPFGLKKK